MIDWLLSKITYGVLEGLRAWIIKQLRTIQKILWVSKRKKQVKDGSMDLKSKDKNKRLRGAKKYEDVYNNRDSK